MSVSTVRGLRGPIMTQSQTPPQDSAKTRDFTWRGASSVQTSRDIPLGEARAHICRHAFMLPFLTPFQK